MKSRLSNYFIGRYLSEATDVFERARIIMFFRFILAFSIIFILPVIADYSLGLYKALIKHSIDLLSLVLLLFSFRFAFNLNKVINFFFGIVFVSYLSAFMILNPTTMDPVAIAWSIFFLGLSALLQRGFARLVYCLLLGWVPLFYVIINIQLNGKLTVEYLAEPSVESPPVFLLFLPIVLLIIAIWSHTNTIQKARETITEQKKLVDEKQKEILDSIHYAKRIQTALVTSESYIDKSIERLRKN